MRLQSHTVQMAVGISITRGGSRVTNLTPLGPHRWPQMLPLSSHGSSVGVCDAM